MAVPYIGSSIEHFIFGPLTEIRIQRIEKTLTEVAASLGEKKAKKAVNEPFTTLLESVIPELSRALNEDKRQRFRDLLTNAAELPEDSKEWEEAQLASTLLKEIGTPGLSILAAIARAEDPDPIVLTSQPVSQVFQGEFDYDHPGEPQQIEHIILMFAQRLPKLLLLGGLKSPLDSCAFDLSSHCSGVDLFCRGNRILRFSALMSV